MSKRLQIWIISDSGLFDNHVSENWKKFAENRLETAVIALNAAVGFSCAGYFLSTRSRGNTNQISESEDRSAYEIKISEAVTADAEETDNNRR